MSEDIDELRGKQATVGQAVLRPFTFVMPGLPPHSDEEVIDSEELLTEIDFAIAPLEAQVDFARKIKKALRKDIEACFEMRKRAEEEPGLFDGKTDEEPKTRVVSSTITFANAADAAKTLKKAARRMRRQAKSE